MGPDLTPYTPRGGPAAAVALLEGVIRRHDWVYATVAGFGRPMSTSRQGSEPDRNPAGAAGAVSFTRRLDNDATCGDAAEPLLQHGNMFQHAGAQFFVFFQALKIDLYRGLHA
jgi:hypothetical protein